MKRLSVLLVAVLLASMGWHVAAADDPVVIHINAMSYRDNQPESDGSKPHENGEACRWPLPTIDIMFAYYQVTIRDEAGTIVAVETLDAGVIRESEDTIGSAFCEQDLAIEVPERAFYTVYLSGLDEVRVTTYSREELPIDSLDVLTVDPEFD